jgi:hypothetical protein
MDDCAPVVQVIPEQVATAAGESLINNYQRGD